MPTSRPHRRRARPTRPRCAPHPSATQPGDPPAEGWCAASARAPIPKRARAEPAPVEVTRVHLLGEDGRAAVVDLDDRGPTAREARERMRRSRGRVDDEVGSVARAGWSPPRGDAGGRWRARRLGVRVAGSGSRVTAGRRRGRRCARVGAAGIAAAHSRRRCARSRQAARHQGLAKKIDCAAELVPGSCRCTRTTPRHLAALRLTPRAALTALERRDWLERFLLAAYAGELLALLRAPPPAHDAGICGRRPSEA